MICQYALNSDNELVFIDHVPNGKDCGCFCPNCKEQMVAKNGGEFKEHHFAHISGIDCGGYRESLLHIWSKQIIEENKMLSIPTYTSLTGGHLFLVDSEHEHEKIFSLPQREQYFKSIEIEKWSDANDLKPDIVGVTKDGLIYWIEIYVTHKCSDEKLAKIKENNINCIEIKIPSEIEDKNQLQEFLLSSTDTENKYFINYPYGESLIREQKRNYLNELKSTCRIVKPDSCNSYFFNHILAKQYTELLQKQKNDILFTLSYFSQSDDFLKTQLEQIIKCDTLSDLSHVVGKAKDRYFDILFTILKQDRCCQDLDLIKVPENNYNNLLQFVGKIYDLYCLYSKKDKQDASKQRKNPCRYIYATSIKNGKSYIFCTNK